MVPVGPLVAARVGEFAGRVAGGVPTVSPGGEAFSVCATKVAAWSWMDGSEDRPGMLQAESNSRNDMDPASVILRVFISIDFP
jgi:hypothetical protein